MSRKKRKEMAPSSINKKKKFVGHLAYLRVELPPPIDDDESPS